MFLKNYLSFLNWFLKNWLKYLRYEIVFSRNIIGLAPRFLAPRDIYVSFDKAKFFLETNFWK